MSGRGNGPNLGALLLIGHLMTQNGRTPIVTLMLVGGQVALYLGIIRPPWLPHDVCISLATVLYDRDYRRLLLSVFEHTSDWHLYFNMISLIMKGQTLEPLYGSVGFAMLVGSMAVVSSSIYVGLSYAGFHYLHDYSYFKTCALGFSGVLFGLKVLTSHRPEVQNWYQDFLFVRVPIKYAVWAELVLIHLLVPNSSFVGHLSGILAGLLFQYHYLITDVFRRPFTRFRGGSNVSSATARLGGRDGVSRLLFTVPANSTRQETNLGAPPSYSSLASYSGTTGTTANLALTTEELRQRRLLLFNM